LIRYCYISINGVLLIVGVFVWFILGGVCRCILRGFTWFISWIRLAGLLVLCAIFAACSFICMGISSMLRSSRPLELWIGFCLVKMILFPNVTCGTIYAFLFITFLLIYLIVIAFLSLEDLMALSLIDTLISYGLTLLLS
jgi:hypothetical protein